jgi:hypothetical protein
VARLEAVTTRLEAAEVRCQRQIALSGRQPPALASLPALARSLVQARLASIAPTSTAAPAARPAAAVAAVPPPPLPPAVSGGGAAPASGAALADFRQLLSTQLAALVDAGEAVGGQVLQATRVLAEGFTREAAIVEAFAACKVRLCRQVCTAALPCLPHLPACLPACYACGLLGRRQRCLLKFHSPHSLGSSSTVLLLAPSLPLSSAEAGCRGIAAAGAACGRADDGSWRPGLRPPQVGGRAAINRCSHVCTLQSAT